MGYGTAMIERRMSQAVRAYPARLISILERCCTRGFGLRVSDGLFELTLDGEVQYTLTPEYDPASSSEITTLEHQLAAIERLSGENQKWEEIKKSALDKLTEAEKLVLGLY